LAIVAILVIYYRKQIFEAFETSKSTNNANNEKAGSNDLVPDKIYEAEQNYLSLLMQAAADRPVNFSEFGISNETYGQIRQALLMTCNNIDEESHWQMQADQTQLIYPPTQKPLTVGDHLLSLDFLAEMLGPIYPVQPIDLNVDETISALADTLDLKAENPMTNLYKNVMKVAPDSTGINRLQRIVLVRSAIVRAIARSVET
jgi:hypothetical protein